jgi:hypothetical protein
MSSERTHIVRPAVLKLFQPEGRGVCLVWWIAVFTVMALIVLAPTISPFFRPPLLETDAALRALPGADRSLRQTDIEREYISKLEIVRNPLPPMPPPPQTLRVAPKRLFGLNPVRQRAFSAVNRQLAELLPKCGQHLFQATHQDLSDMKTSLGAAEMETSRERTIFHYPEGLISLCTGNPKTAEDEFEKALGSLDSYNGEVKASGRSLSGRDRRWLQQYRTVLYYGAGLARMANREDASAADADFVRALDAAKTARPFNRGPFVVMSADAGDLFDFSTAQIVNARLFLRMFRDESESERQSGYAAIAELAGALAGALNDVLEYPDLAANFAMLSVSRGRTDVGDDMYARLRRSMETGGPASVAWQNENRPALVRMVTAGVLGSQPVYSDQDSWWPRAVTPSLARNRYDQREGATTEFWFPQIDLPPDDGEIADLWLWVRLDRHWLANRELKQFQTDADAISRLAPEDRKFLEAWRSEITHDLGNEWFEYAETIRGKEGLAEARPLLEILASPGFPFWVRMKARLVLCFHISPWWVLAWEFLALLIAVGLAWLHYQLRAGYARTFARRHYFDRKFQSE